MKGRVAIINTFVVTIFEVKPVMGASLSSEEGSWVVINIC